MENASKALIIAGAILLSILIISLGIMIYQQASGVVDSNAMDEVAVNSFNQKFTQYEGENVRGSNVNALINTIIQNNLTNSNDASKQIIITTDESIVEGTSWSGEPYGEKQTGTKAQTTKKGSAMTGKSYKVKFHADPKSGYVDEVTISAA